MASLLQITAADIKAKLNPLNSPNGFMGANSQIASSTVTSIIDEHEEYVLSRIPQKYQALLYHIPGEVLVGAGRTQAGAKGGETTLQLGLTPVENVLIYVNYDGVWSDRTADHALADDAYTVDEETGEITLSTGLTRGDRVVATYDHSAMPKCKLLRRIVLDMAATEVARRIHRSTEHFEVYESWATQAYSDLKRMERDDEGKLSIKFFDDLDLVVETSNNRTQGTAFDWTGGGYL